MKRILFIITLVIISMSMAMAQSPQGGGGGRPGGMGGGQGQRPPMRGEGPNQAMNTSDEYWIMHFPELPDLSQDNKRKMIDLLSKEKMEMDKLMREKMVVEDKIFNIGDSSEKEANKLAKKMNKIETSMRKAADNYDSKYQKILTPEQYIIFKEKKKEIKFRKPRDARRNAMDGDENQRKDMPEGNMPPPPGGMPMFGGGPE